MSNHAGFAKPTGLTCRSLLDNLINIHMKILTIVGARPQFIKAAVLSRVISNQKGVNEVIIHTGQHFDKNMSEIFFEEMDIPKPHYNLNINSLSHGAMTGRMLEKIEDLIIKEAPDVVVVYGDTNSTIAGALAAKKLHVKVAHVEAGLRSYNTEMPEEINRILTDRISDYLFCPTIASINNLKNEGFDNLNNQFYNVGDVMLDAALFYGKKSVEKSSIINRLNLKKFALCTIHRAENADNPEKLTGIFEALNKLNNELPVLLPLHPRTQEKAEKLKIKPSFTIIEPVGYFDIIEILKHCNIVLTDSGGLQKEAFFFGKPCITLREETEWIELTAHSFNKLAGANPARIINAYKEFLCLDIDFNIQLYGDGKAGEKIINTLLSEIYK